MFGLSNNLQRRMAFYKSKMPAHGATLAAVVKNYASPAYASKGPCPSYATQEDMRRGYPVTGWYGFPDVYARKESRFPQINDFNGVFGLRCVAAAGTLDSQGDSLRNRDAEGYYTDSFADRTVYPLVFRLNGGRGFITGRYESDNGEVCIKPQRYDDARTAFYAAHSDCERYAGECRNADIEYQAESRIEELRGEVTETRRGIIALVQDVRKARAAGACNFPAIEKALRDQVAALLGERAEAYAAIAKLQNDPHSIAY